MPTNPPPPRMKFSNAACSTELRISPVVFKKTTTRYFANSASLKRDVSSELTTVKPCSFPRARIAAIPAGIESCRNPAVFVNTRMLNRLASAAGRAAADATNIHTDIAVQRHTRLANVSLMELPDLLTNHYPAGLLQDKRPITK